MEVIPGVYQITSRMTNVILIAEDRLTLVDAGFRGAAGKIASYINSLGRSINELELIIITHNHLDHVGGLPELRKMTRAKVAVGKADLSERESGLPYPRYLIKLMHFPLIALLRPLVYARPGEVDIRLEGGEVLGPLGGLLVVPTPGHTPGSISLYSQTKKLLIVGDAINNRLRDLRLPPKDLSTDMGQAKDSIKRLARLDFDTICFGHGRPIIGGAQARLREWMEGKGL